MFFLINGFRKKFQKTKSLVHLRNKFLFIDFIEKDKDQNFLFLLIFRLKIVRTKY